MSAMVERVARAIEAVPIMSGTYAISGDDAVLLARAAIEAIGEPTDAMIARAMAPYVYGNDEAMNEAFRKTITEYWQAMIDEALK